MRPGLAIYEPRGRAKEFSPLAVNLYKGCGHGCAYCYVPEVVTFMGKDEFAKAGPRVGIIEKLSRDLPKVIEDRDMGNVLLCFTCDPYQPINDSLQLTGKAIGVLHYHGFKVTVLTKGGKRSEADLSLLGPGDNYAVSLTLLDEKKSLQWEPGAAIPEERIEILKKAHDLGITTWASLEPVIDPAVTLEIIKQTHQFVDLFKVGKMNYHKIEKTIDWAKFLADAVDTLDMYGSNYYIKKDLLHYKQSRLF